MDLGGSSTGEMPWQSGSGPAAHCCFSSLRASQTQAVLFGQFIFFLKFLHNKVHIFSMIERTQSVQFSGLKEKSMLVIANVVFAMMARGFLLQPSKSRWVFFFGHSFPKKYYTINNYPLV